MLLTAVLGPLLFLRAGSLCASLGRLNSTWNLFLHLTFLKLYVSVSERVRPQFLLTFVLDSVGDTELRIPRNFLSDKGARSTCSSNVWPLTLVPNPLELPG